MSDAAPVMLRPPMLVCDYAIGIDRFVDGSAQMIIHHGGHKMALVLTDEHRRQLGRYLLQAEAPTPCEFGVCDPDGAGA